MLGQRRLCLVASLLIAAIASCSSAPTPLPSSTRDLPPVAPTQTGTTPTTATPSPSSSSATATGSSPVVPSAARAHTPEGAEAFVRFYIDQVNLAWTTPQTGLIPALSLPTCKGCKGLEEDAARLVQARQRYATDPLAVEKVEWGEVAENRQELVTLRVIDRPSRVLGPSDLPSPSEARVTETTMLLKFQDGWKVQEIGQSE